MRTTYTLFSPLPKRDGRHKRYFLNGNRIDTPEMVNLLLKFNVNIEEKYMPNKLPCNEYKGILLGYSFGGLQVWAKNNTDTPKLFSILNDEGKIKAQCRNMPVVLREDK